MPNWCSNNIHLKANPQILDKVVKQILIKDGEEYKFNFQHFLPMPKELDIEESSTSYIQQSWLDIKQQPQRKFIELEEEIKNKYHMPANIFSEMKQYFSELFDWSNLTVGEIFIHFEENPEIASRFYYFHDLANRIAENIEKYGHVTWYGWRLSNWGCTWDVCDDSTYVTVGAEDIWINCDTAWGPPEESIMKSPDVFRMLNLKPNILKMVCGLQEHTRVSRVRYLNILVKKKKSVHSPQNTFHTNMMKMINKVCFYR